MSSWSRRRTTWREACRGTGTIVIASMLPDDRTNPGYDWPRHAGATFFLAQAAGLTQDPFLRDACSRAASLLRGSGLSSCAGLPCVGDEPIVSLGSSALALLAISEVVERGIDDSYRPLVIDLARFIRSQERTDGEFVHRVRSLAGAPHRCARALLFERSNPRIGSRLQHHARPQRSRWRRAGPAQPGGPGVELLR